MMKADFDRRAECRNLLILRIDLFEIFPTGYYVSESSKSSKSSVVVVEGLEESSDISCALRCVASATFVSSPRVPWGVLWAGLFLDR